MRSSPSLGPVFAGVGTTAICCVVLAVLFKIQDELIKMETKEERQR